MNKKDLLLKYFQKANLLTVSNNQYRKALSSLFEWLTKCDGVNCDNTTRFIDMSYKQKAFIVTKENGIIAGLEEISYLLGNYTHLSMTPKVKDGNTVNINQSIAIVEGKSSEILSYERTILNILQRMSGIATQTDKLIKILHPQPTTHSPQCFLAATRKTPWMFLDKKAVSVGGGLSHRLNLSDGFLIKDNHLRSIKTKYHLKDKTEAINKFIMINSPFNPDVMIEVEVEEEKEALTLLSTKQKIKSPFNLTVMFDNFTPENAKKTIEKLKKKFDLSNIIIEGSGGINEKNLLNWASTGVDFISIGSLTHSTRALNLSLEF